MNSDAKINRILANQTQEHIKNFVMIKWLSYPQCKDSSIYANHTPHQKKRKSKHYIVISINSERTFDNKQDPVMIKTHSNIAVDETFLKI